MRARFPVLALRPALLAAVFAGLLVTGEGRSQQKNPKQKDTAKQAAKVEEAAVLKDAYVLMAMANHDYDGHRVKAMGHVEHAIKRLDDSVMKNGTNGQKVVALKDEIDTARAKFLAERRGPVPEGQALSDLQLNEAAKLIAKVHGASAAMKQPKIHEQVQNAINELKIALAIR
jgi:hypothetical protein